MIKKGDIVMRRALTSIIIFTLTFLSIQSGYAATNYANSSDGPIFKVGEPLVSKTNAILNWELTYEYHKLYQLSGYHLVVNKIGYPKINGSFEGKITNGTYDLPYLLPGLNYEVEITPFTTSKVWTVPTEKVFVKTIGHQGWLKVIFNGAFGYKKSEWLYFDPSTGLDKKGWLLDKGKWYYFQDKFSILENKNIGVMTTGWQKVNNKWYYLNINGDMKTGWLLYNNKWYYLNKSGDMKTGWLSNGNNWFYLNADGSMVDTGWKLINNKWYYFYSNGKMASNVYIQGYKIGKDGSWIK